MNASGTNHTYGEVCYDGHTDFSWAAPSVANSWPLNYWYQRQKISAGCSYAACVWYLRNDQIGQWKKVHNTRASFFNLSMSSSTDEMMTPAFLLGGSVTWTTSKSDLISTFSSSRVTFLMTFDFAFIMFGSVAYLGWFKRRSVLQH